jgi:hypothetical protein
MGSHSLPTYQAVPQQEVRLEEFELFAINHLQGAIFIGSPPCYHLPSFRSLDRVGLLVDEAQHFDVQFSRGS